MGLLTQNLRTLAMSRREAGAEAVLTTAKGC